MSKQQLQSLRQEAISLISKMSDDQCAVVMEAFKLSMEDITEVDLLVQIRQTLRHVKNGRFR